jgi:hypothetical protein
MKGARCGLSLIVALLVAVPAAWAQEKTDKPAAAGEMPPYIKAAHTFLMAWGTGKWDEAKAVAADKVVVKAGDKEYAVDVAGGKAEAALVFPFKGLSTVRAGGKVEKIAVGEIGVKAEGTEKRGKGSLTLEEKGGQFVVTGVTVD